MCGNVYTNETDLVLFKIGCCKFKMLLVILKVTANSLKISRKGKKGIKMIHYKHWTKYQKSGNGGTGEQKS